MDKKVNNPIDENRLPGIEINKADNDKVSANLVKEETKTLNNNPRNSK